MTQQKNLVLVDVFGLLYKFFFTLPRMTAPGGQPTNAAFGLARTLLKLSKDEDIHYLVPALESHSPTFRHEMFDDYKAHREKMPDNLRSQLPMVTDLLQAMGLNEARAEGYEADDVIGTLARRASEQGINVRIITGDKDMLQLVNDRVQVLMSKKGVSELEVFDREKVRETLGVYPEQVPDLKGLEGDKSDNIPGVPGVGAKTALLLLDQYQTLEGVFEHIPDITKKKLKENLENNHEKAVLSKKLATIECDAPLDIALESYSFKPAQDTTALAEIFHKFNFKSLIRELGLEKDLEDASMEKTAAFSEGFETITDERKLIAVIDRIKSVKKLCIDLETTGLDQFADVIVGYALATEPGRAYYVPVRHIAEEKAAVSGDIFDSNTDDNEHDDQENIALIGQQLSPERVLKLLEPILTNPEINKLGHNLKYDALMLRNAGVNMAGIAFDSMLASYLLDPSGRSHSLKAVAGHLLGIHFKTYEDIVGKGKKQICFDSVPIATATQYACMDVDMVLRIQDILTEQLKSQNLWDVFMDLEMPLVDVLIEMEYNGVAIDENLLKKLSITMSEKENEILAHVQSISGKEINLKSPKQVAELLFDDLGLEQVKKRSTDISVLEELENEHQVVPLIIEYRQLSKLTGTYVDALPALIKKKTGRIHTSFNQHITATGRLSSSNPNLQNIPIRTSTGREIRRAFVTGEPGKVILAADYSQVEIRLLAGLSRDPALIEAFDKGQDIHTRTASDVFGAPLEQVTKDQRRYAKTINFGIIYGMREFRLAKTLGISRFEAAEFIENYFQRYPAVRDFIERTKEEVQKNGYVTTMFGRRRTVPEVNSRNKNEQQAGFRAAFNTIIQGTAADVMKAAMISIHQAIVSGKLNAKMILQVHDELVFETPHEHVQDTSQIVENLMRNAGQPHLSLPVPLTVDVGVGSNWLDLETL